MNNNNIRHHGHSICGTVFGCLLFLCCCPFIPFVGSWILFCHVKRKAKHWEPRHVVEAREKERWEREVRLRTPRILGPRKARLSLEGSLEIQDGTDEAKVGVSDRQGKVEEGNEEILEKVRIDHRRGDAGQAVVRARKTESQGNALFFKLPLEIRRQIYGEVLGGYIFHIQEAEAYRRLCHTRCKSETPENCECMRMWKREGAKDNWGQSDLTAVLKTCRIIYTEALPILYTKNTFSFDRLSDVLKLSIILPHGRMALMRSVQWHIDPVLTRSTGYTIYEAQRGYCTYRPWLECIKGEGVGCCCASCLPPHMYRDLNDHPWVLYHWMMRMIELKLKIEQQTAIT